LPPASDHNRAELDALKEIGEAEPRRNYGKLLLEPVTKLDTPKNTKGSTSNPSQVSVRRAGRFLFSESG
jgi:hypothetical protein